MNPKHRVETLEEAIVEMGKKVIEQHQRLASQVRSNCTDKRDQLEVTFTFERKDGSYSSFMKIKHHHRIATPIGFLRLEESNHE